jgi:hypothetical protein
MQGREGGSLYRSLPCKECGGVVRRSASQSRAGASCLVKTVWRLATVCLPLACLPVANSGADMC